MLGNSPERVDCLLNAFILTLNCRIVRRNGIGNVVHFLELPGQFVRHRFLSYLSCRIFQLVDIG